MMPVVTCFPRSRRGLEYLRNGRELREQGLYAELSEYQFHVFMDFREIRDDPEGSWGRLCAALNGRGAESLEDELKQLRHASLNSAFQAILKLVPEKPEGVLAAVIAKQGDIVHSAQRFLAVLKAQLVGKGARIADTLKTIPECITGLASLLSIKPTSSEARAFLAKALELIGSVAGARLLLAWLLLRDTGVEPEDFGLDYTLKNSLAGIDSNDARRTAQLLKALLAYHHLSDGEGKQKVAATTMGKLFSLAASRDFMQVHESDGVEWFNKECFEELSEWLKIIEFTSLAAQRPAGRTLTAGLAKAERELKLHVELAAHAGYRTGLFLSLLEPTLKVGGKDVSKSKKLPKAHRFDTK